MTLDTLQRPLLAAIEMDLPDAITAEEDDDTSSTWTSASVSMPGTPQEDRNPAGDDISL